MTVMASAAALPEAMLAPMSLFGRYSIFFADVPVTSAGSLLPAVRRDDAKLGGDQAKSGVAGNEIYPFDALVRLQAGAIISARKQRRLLR